MSEIKDKEIQQASGGKWTQIVYAGEQGIPQERVHIQSIACDKFILWSPTAKGTEKICGHCLYMGPMEDNGIFKCLYC